MTMNDIQVSLPRQYQYPPPSLTSGGMRKPFGATDGFDARLQTAMQKRGVDNVAAFARSLDLNPVTVRAYSNGYVKPSKEVCETLARALDVSFDWLYKGKGGMDPISVPSSPNKSGGANVTPPKQISPSPNRGLVPIYGQAAGGKSGAIAIGAIVDMVASPPGLEEAVGAYAVYVIGDSMEPRYEAGEMLFVHPNKPVRKGNYCVVQIEDEDGTVYGIIKRYIGQTGGELVLESLNPRETLKIPLHRVRAVGRVVGTLE